MLKVFGSSDLGIKEEILSIVGKRIACLDGFSLSLETNTAVAFLQKHTGQEVSEAYQSMLELDQYRGAVATLNKESRYENLNFSAWRSANTNLVLYQIITSIFNSVDNIENYENILLYLIQKLLLQIQISYSDYNRDIPKTEGDTFLERLNLQENPYFNAIQKLLLQKCEIDPFYYGEQFDNFEYLEKNILQLNSRTVIIGNVFKNQYEKAVPLIENITALIPRFNSLGDQFEEIVLSSVKVKEVYTKRKLFLEKPKYQVLGEKKILEFLDKLTIFWKTKEEPETAKRINVLKGLIFSDIKYSILNEFSSYAEQACLCYVWDRYEFFIKSVKEYSRDLDVLIRRATNIIRPLSRFQKLEEQKRTELQIENIQTLDELLRTHCLFKQNHLFIFEAQMRYAIEAEQKSTFASIQDERMQGYTGLPWQAHLSFRDYLSLFQEEEIPPQVCEPKLNSVDFFRSTKLNELIGTLEEGASIPQNDMIRALEAFGYLIQKQGSECTYQIWDQLGNRHLAFIHLRHGDDTAWTARDWRYKQIIAVLQRAGFL